MADEFKIRTGCHLFLVRDEKLLLVLRQNTGHWDGHYGLVAGHVEANETLKQAMRRETREEAGISIETSSLELVHIINCIGKEGEKLMFFWSPNKWKGTPFNKETDKHSEINWFALDRLPQNTIPYIKFALENIKDSILYSEYIEDHF